MIFYLFLILICWLLYVILASLPLSSDQKPDYDHIWELEEDLGIPHLHERSIPPSPFTVEKIRY